MRAKVIRSDYYNRFQCKGSDCKNTCCQSWNISLNKKEYNELKSVRLSSELDTVRKRAVRRNRTSITDARYGKIVLSEGGLCPILSQNGLCRLQVECGHRILPRICKQFPRELALEGNVLEEHLFLGCEAVVELLIDCEKGVMYVEAEDATMANSMISTIVLKEAKNKRPLYNYLHGIRRLMASTMQCDKLPAEERILTLGLFLQTIDQLEKNQALSEISGYITEMELALNQPEISFLWDSVKPDNDKKMIGLIKPLIEHFMRTGTCQQPESQAILQRFGVTLTAEDDHTFTSHLEVRESPEVGFYKFIGDRSHIVGNIAANLFLSMDILFQFKMSSIWNNYVATVRLYQLFYALLVGTVSEDSTDAEFVQAVVRHARGCLHAEQYRIEQVTQAEREEITLEELAAQLKR